MASRSVRWLLFALAGVPCGVSRAEVHPDCFDAKWGTTCFKARIEDASLVDEIIAPALAHEGWERACYRIQYVKGDNGGPDAILVNVEGAAGEGAPKCRLPPDLTEAEKADVRRRSRGAQDVWKNTADKMAAKGQARAPGEKLLRRVAVVLRKALLTAPAEIRGRVLRNVDVVTLVDGCDGQADAPLK